MKYILNFRILFTFIILLFFFVKIKAQDSTQTFQEIILLKEKEIPALSKKINISVGNVSINEFLRGVANNSGANIDIDPNLRFNVSNNFNNVSVADILLFLDRKFDIDIRFIGNIITIKGTGKPIQEEIEHVIYNREEGVITIDYQNSLLSQIVREISKKTACNLIISPDLNNKQISGYIHNMPLYEALKRLAFANNIIVEKADKNVYIFKSGIPVNNTNYSPISNYNRGRQVDLTSFRQKGIQVSTEKIDSICLYANKAKKIDLIEVIASQLKINYFISSDLKGEISLNVSGISFEQFLDFVLSGSNYTYKKFNNVYIIGGKSINELNEYRVISLKHRTIDSLINLLPKEMIKEIEIKEFGELNSIFIAGASNKISLVEQFLKNIDKPVPVILIEIIIVDVTKTHSVETGISAGLGKPPKTSQSILPKIDYTLNSGAVNDLINKFNGFGWVNLGNVSENFYLTLKAMEENGLLEIKSTPKLSTLNGHRANLKIGETKYYREERSQLYGTQNPTQTNSYEYKSVDADLEINIRPIVSGDNQITLDISVKQSDFDLTASLGEGAPPNKRNKEFKSKIRIKNEDVIILGGLEQKKSIKSGSGVPILSRIPILKWFFSSQNKNKSSAKLNVFIKPTIIG